MSGLELLEKYPLTAKIVRDWFLNQMMESFKDDTVPEGFKQYMRDQGIDNDKVAPMIDSNPRMLFDVFDENEIFICINHHPINGFSYDDSTFYKTRKESEINAITDAFNWLENNLTPKEETNENNRRI